ncbi:hypothetical protein [Streptomyces eurythermus]
MPARTTVASVSGAALGATATIALTGRQPESEAVRDGTMMLVWFFAMVCVTLVASASLRKWIRAYDDSNRHALDEIARQRAAFNEASAARAHELNERENRLNDQAEMAGAQLMSLATRLDEALISNTQMERRLTEMTRMYEELACDHNQLIRETLQERADRFAYRGHALRPPAPRTAPAQSSDSPVRTYADPYGGHAPVAPIPLPLPGPAVQLSDESRHDRPVEGVGGPA